MSLSHRCSRKVLSVVQSPATKLFLKVHLLHCIDVVLLELTGSLCLALSCTLQVGLSICCPFVAVWVGVLHLWAWCGPFWMHIGFGGLCSSWLVLHVLNCCHSHRGWTLVCCQCWMDDESASLVGEDFSSCCVFSAGSKALVSSIIVCVWLWPVVIIDGAFFLFCCHVVLLLCLVIVKGYCWLGWPLVLPALVEVPFILAKDFGWLHSDCTMRPGKWLT